MLPVTLTLQCCAFSLFSMDLVCERSVIAALCTHWIQLWLTSGDKDWLLWHIICIAITLELHLWQLTPQRPAYQTLKDEALSWNPKCDLKAKDWKGKATALSSTNTRLCVKVQSMILTQYIFCQIQRIAPHGPLAVHSVFALKKLAV